MERSFYYRVTLYSLITVLSVVVLIPSFADWTRRSDRLPDWFKKQFTRKISLGLDLQGGLHLVYEVQVEKAVSDKADRLAAQLEEKLAKDKKVKGMVGLCNVEGLGPEFWTEGGERKALDPSRGASGHNHEEQHIHCIACGRHLDASEFNAPVTARYISCQHGSTFPTCVEHESQSRMLLAEHDRTGQAVQMANAWH